MIGHHHVRTNDVTLHVASAGPADGPLVIFLHGFPEGWFVWAPYLEAFAAAGYRVLAPDQRGYGDSDKPPHVEDYEMDALVDDVVGLIDGEGKKKAIVVGHDWGAVVAWWTALRHPDRVERLCPINMSHPWVMRDFLLKNPAQLRKSWYILFFQIPLLPERAWLRRGRAMFDDMRSIGRPDAFTDADADAYLEAWSKPNAMRSMMNWYRAAIRLALRPPDDVDLRIRVPTLVLWGRKDSILSEAMVEPSLAYCDDGRVVWFDDATHWVNHEEREGVTEALLAFAGIGASPAHTGGEGL